MAYIFITVLLVLTIYSLPGVILSHLVWKDTASRTEKLLFGSVIGIAFSCYISIIAAFFLDWEPFAIIGSILMLAAIGLLAKTKFPNIGHIHGSASWTKGEFIACVAAVCIVSIFLYVTFSQVGHATDLGYRYSWLFGHDFINKAINAVSLTHSIPPPHFFFAPEMLKKVAV